jgi:hypothetical protein
LPSSSKLFDETLAVLFNAPGGDQLHIEEPHRKLALLSPVITVSLGMYGIHWHGAL